MSRIACSATELELEPGACTTGMPSSVAAARSTMSRPTPCRPITLRFGNADMSAREQRGLERNRMPAASLASAIMPASLSESDTTATRASCSMRRNPSGCRPPPTTMSGFIWAPWKRGRKACRGTRGALYPNGGSPRSMSEFAIRSAAASDAATICIIYNQGIEDRIATLETELRTPEERRQWLAARGPRHPVFVAEVAGAGPAVVGWGSLNVYNTREAYRYVADFSVYVERGWRGRGVGRRLLEHLIEQARALDYHKMMLSTFPLNESGVALYERMGFTKV